MIIPMYIALGVLICIMSAVLGAVIPALQGRAPPRMADPRPITVIMCFLGLPSYYIIAYLHRHMTTGEGTTLLIILMYIALGVLICIMSAVLGAVIAVLQGRADPFLAYPPFVIIDMCLLGIPSYFIIVYLHRHHDLTTWLWVLAIPAVIGFLVGFDPRRRW